MTIDEMRRAMLSAASSLAERDAREVADAIAHGTVPPDTPPLTRATVHMLADVLHAEALWAGRDGAATLASGVVIPESAPMTYRPPAEAVFAPDDSPKKAKGR